MIIFFIYKFIKKRKKKNKNKNKKSNQKVIYYEKDFNNEIDDANSDNEPSLSKEDISSIQEEPKIGLNNIGATCYMNATLQCLSHTKNLTNYFLSSRGQKAINSGDNQLSKLYLEVIKKLWLKKYNKN